MAKQLEVSRQTVHKWVRRYCAEGEAGLPTAPRGRAPARGAPCRTSSRDRRGAAPPGLPRLAEVDRVTGELLRTRASDVRYERARPGELVHVDVKTLGKVSDGGGWRVHGRGVRRAGGRGGWAHVHVAPGDATRIGYAEVPPTRGGPAAQRSCTAARWFRDEHGITIERVLTDDAKCYRSSAAWKSEGGRFRR